MNKKYPEYFNEATNTLPPELREKPEPKKCVHDWHTNGLGVTYCWNCRVVKAPS